MPTTYYPAVINREKSKDGESFTIQFFDVPGAISWGRSMEEALAHGAEALALALDGEDHIPEPTPFDEVLPKIAAGNMRAEFIQMVEVQMPESVVRVNVTLPGHIVARIDKAAGNYGRSDFLANAAREKLARESTPERRSKVGGKVKG